MARSQHGEETQQLPAVWCSRVASPEERPGHTAMGIFGTTHRVSLEYMEQSKARGQESAGKGQRQEWDTG